MLPPSQLCARACGTIIRRHDGHLAKARQLQTRLVAAGHTFGQHMLAATRGQRLPAGLSGPLLPSGEACSVASALIRHPQLTPMVNASAAIRKRYEHLSHLRPQAAGARSTDGPGNPILDANVFNLAALLAHMRSG